MDPKKVDIATSGERVSFHVPLSKVDEQKRLVHGFATLDNLDKHRDIVTKEASSKAFSKFRGNIREMHTTKAVGRMVSFAERTIRDAESGNEYTGIYVTARISKGAQDTWEKVLDGTLSGFSIQGPVIKREDLTLDDGSLAYRIDEYELNELSLVDSPANPLANVLKVEKLVDGTLEFTGDAVDEAVDLACQECNIIEKSVDAAVDCAICGTEMVAVETEETIEKEVESKGSTIKLTLNLLNPFKGGNAMANKEEGEAVEVEKAADVEEVEVEQAETETDAAVGTPEIDYNAIAERVAELIKSEEAPVDEEPVAEEEDATDEVLKGLSDSLAEIAKAMKSFDARVESLETATAVKKSVSTDDSEEDDAVEKSVWGNALGVKQFLGSE